MSSAFRVARSASSPRRFALLELHPPDTSRLGQLTRLRVEHRFRAGVARIDLLLGFALFPAHRSEDTMVEHHPVLSAIRSWPLSSNIECQQVGRHHPGETPQPSSSSSGLGSRRHDESRSSGLPGPAPSASPPGRRRTISRLLGHQSRLRPGSFARLMREVLVVAAVGVGVLLCPGSQCSLPGPHARVHPTSSTFSYASTCARGSSDSPRTR